MNGKGAAHVADVLMNPPMQIPFSYPALIFLSVRLTMKKSDYQLLEMRWVYAMILMISRLLRIRILGIEKTIEGTNTL